MGKTKRQQGKKQKYTEASETIIITKNNDACIPSSDAESTKYVNLDFYPNSASSIIKMKPSASTGPSADGSNGTVQNLTANSLLKHLNGTVVITRAYCITDIARVAQLTGKGKSKVSSKFLTNNIKNKANPQANRQGNSEGNRQGNLEANRVGNPEANPQAITQGDDDENWGVPAVNFDNLGIPPLEVNKWAKILQPPKEYLVKILLYMVTNNIKTNIEVIIGGITFNCHLLVLQCFSQWFLGSTDDTITYLPPEEVSPYAFKKIYQWMLTEEEIIKRDDILEIFRAANFLRINELISQCWLALDNDKVFCEDTSYLLYMKARSYSIGHMENLMMQRVCRFFIVLVASKEFLRLNIYDLCQLLDSNMIGVNSEVEVFMAAARWLEYNWAARQKYVLEVIKNIRFSLMPPWFLVAFNKTTGCPEVDRITQQPEIRQMISDGISYSTTHLYFKNSQTEFTNFLDKYNLVIPNPRRWIYDRRCVYHHRFDCTEMQHLTYDIFLDYLDTIRVSGRNYWTSLEISKTMPEDFKCCRKYIMAQMSTPI